MEATTRIQPVPQTNNTGRDYHRIVNRCAYEGSIALKAAGWCTLAWSVAGFVATFFSMCHLPSRRVSESTVSSLAVIYFPSLLVGGCVATVIGDKGVRTFRRFAHNPANLGAHLHRWSFTAYMIGYVALFYSVFAALDFEFYNGRDETNPYAAPSILSIFGIITTTIWMSAVGHIRNSDYPYTPDKEH